jgi:multidrug efflux system outer membrane protein
MHTVSTDRRSLIALCCIGACFLTGCLLGPNYEQPGASTPARWRWASPEKPPGSALGTEWWASYNDPDLDALQRRALASNQGLRRAIARLEESRAALGLARADRLPSTVLGSSAIRDRRSPNRRLRNDIDIDLNRDLLTRNRFTLSLSTQYELDFWGRVRRLNEAAQAQLESQEAAQQTVALTISADVARLYFEIRSFDAEIEALNRSIAVRRSFLNASKTRLAGGLGAEADVSRAETEIADAESELIEVQRVRTLMEHALAVLCGEAPSDFRLPTRNLPLPPPPSPPPGLPSELLARRPDVAEAERLAASRCAAIGVAKASFLPAVFLTGAAGFESVDIQNVFSWESHVWSFGPSVSVPIFQGRRNRANLKAAEARYEQAVAEYRERALIAFREVEDALVNSQYYLQKAQAQSKAIDSARRTAAYYDQRMRAGLINFLDVIDSQRSLLKAERSSIQTLARQYETSVMLMKALGGGWHSASSTNAPTPTVEAQSSPAAQ